MHTVDSRVLNDAEYGTLCRVNADLAATGGMTLPLEKIFLPGTLESEQEKNPQADGSAVA